MKDLLFKLPELELPTIPGNSVQEIKENGKVILSKLDEKHQAELKALDEINQENTRTIQEYCSALDKEIKEAKKRKDFSKVLKLMQDMNKIMSKLV